MSREELGQLALLVLALALCAVGVYFRLQLCGGLRCTWVVIP